MRGRRRTRHLAFVIGVLAGAGFFTFEACAAGIDAHSALGRLQDYKDWEIGCDNARACVALGMGADEGAFGAYLRIAREGEAEATPEVSFVVFPPDDSSGSIATPLATLAFVGAKAGALPSGKLALFEGGDVYRYRLPDEALAGLLDGLRSASAITVDLYDGDRKLGSETISLAGSAAALLQMDDAQKRIGTVTALMRKGDAAAATIPAVPALPRIVSLPVAALDPLPKPPAGLPKPTRDDCSEGVPPYVAFDLGKVGGSGARLWGTCVSTGAYNYAYAYRLLIGGKLRPVKFLVPGAAADDDPSWLWNAYADDGQRTLNSFMKGRGLGDCGDAETWAFDGKGFALLQEMAMGACRGVLQEDWPVLYRAEAK